MIKLNELVCLFGTYSHVRDEHNLQRGLDFLKKVILTANHFYDNTISNEEVVVHKFNKWDYNWNSGNDQSIPEGGRGG